MAVSLSFQALALELLLRDCCAFMSLVLNKNPRLGLPSSLRATASRIAPQKSASVECEWGQEIESSDPCTSGECSRATVAQEERPRSSMPAAMASVLSACAARQRDGTGSMERIWKTRSCERASSFDVMALGRGEVEKMMGAPGLSLLYLNLPDVMVHKSTV